MEAGSLLVQSGVEGLPLFLLATFVFGSRRPQVHRDVGSFFHESQVTNHESLPVTVH